MIEVKNLYYRYEKKDKDAVSNVSFNIEKGEIFGFLGPCSSIRVPGDVEWIDEVLKYEKEVTLKR